MEIEYYKNGEKATLRTIRVLKAADSGAVRISRYYQTPIFSILITRRVYIGRVEMDGKYRMLSSLRILTLAFRGGRPLLSVRFPSSYRMVESEKAVKVLEGLLNER